ncbi:AAA family ATPase [Kroppenstedtia eburnea]|uniref:Uncharacterized protein YhaN n=1 Tax=Kroppenstedtia eburnea TaxID=714067 RepID=A0A1N7KJ87_9BACL|nr:AAA family ATPase [Kroppenstedtia eburnea]QKI82952.1 AAA family ATPase [Kroppenstedtia eburnea]SIS61665.1 Uncharacterized protein YhaN [Kroppenstedtia eburnea]
MKLKRVYFRGFGRWVDREFRFQEGLNLIEAPNESGKSTLIRGLTALLYGGKKEGVGRRVREDWLEAYQPWNGKDYGGEVDFTLGEREYRLIRTLQWEEEREQLVDPVTGRDLSGDFPMDRRKDRNFTEGLTGLSRSLFQRVAWIRSLPMSGDHQVVDKIRQLVHQGEEMNVRPALERLEKEIQGIGKTPAAKNKPYGVISAKCAELEAEVTALRETYRSIREDQARLAGMKKEWAELAEKEEHLSRRMKKLQEALNQAKEREALLEKQKHLEYIQERWTEAVDQVTRLEREREGVKPPYLLSPEEVEEIRGLIDGNNRPEDRADRIEERLRSLAQEIQDWEEKNSSLLQLDERWLQKQLSDLEEGCRLQENLKTPDFQETIDDRVKGIQMEKDYKNLTALQHREEELRKERGTLEDQRRNWRMRLDLIEREKFLTQVVDAQVPPARSSFRWLWLTGAGLAFFLLMVFLIPGLSIAGLLFSIFASVRYWRLRQVDRQVRQEWDERHEGLKRDRERVRRERRELESGGESLSDPDHLREGLAKTEEKLNEVHHSLAMVIQEQEALLNRWKADSTVELRRLVEEKFQQIRDREEARKQDREHRERLEEIRREAEEGATVFRDRLGTFEFRSWLKEWSAIGEEAQKARDKLTSLRLESTTLEKELHRLIPEMEHRSQQRARWKEKLGSDDPALWTEWMLASEHVRRLDDRLEAARSALRKETERKEAEAWDLELERVRKQLEEKGNEGQASAAELAGDLQKLERELEWIKEKHREKETEVLRLEERLQTLLSGVPSLAERETQLAEARSEKERLERERIIVESAKEVLEEATRELREDLSPRLAPHASRWIGKVTGGRYRDLLIDPAEGISLSVFVPETGERQPIERLSRGTVDQMYFAMRLALIRFFAEHGNLSLPVILDDSLVHFDGERIREALRILGEMAGEHQVILCTCQSRERRLLEEEGIPFELQALS